MLSLDNFKAIELKDKKIFNKFYEKYPPVHSDYVFTTLVSWMDYANYHFTVYKNNLIIYSKIDNQIRFRPPIGKKNKQVFEEVMALAKNQKSDYPFGMIDLKTKEWMQKVFPNIGFEAHRAYFDYVYFFFNLCFWMY